jgi:hypothetical protein
MQCSNKPALNEYDTVKIIGINKRERTLPQARACPICDQPRRGLLLLNPFFENRRTRNTEIAGTGPLV